MNQLLHVTRRVFDAPLLIEPGKLEVILHRVIIPRLAGAGDLPRPEALVAERQPGRRGWFLGPGGIAVVPVVGTTVQRQGWLDAESGLVSYERLEGLLAEVMGDGQARGILLDVDSHGGEAAGLFTLVAKLREAANTKPVWAVANEAAFSAGYALASAAQRVYLPPTAGVGSIGVIAVHVDQSQADAKKGLTYTAIKAGAHKDDLSPHQPLTDAGRGTVQRMVDGMYAIFCRSVAAGRGLDEAAVRATEAGLYFGPDAVEAGLADGLATLDEVLALMNEELDRPRGPGAGATAGDTTQHMEETMPTATEPAAAPAAQTPNPTGQAGAPEAAQPKAPTREPQPEPTQAAAQERARIKGILDSPEALGRAKLAQHLALETDLAPEVARQVLAAAAAETPETPEAGRHQPPNPLARAMADLKEPTIEPGGEGEEADEAQMAAAILGAGKEGK